MDNLIFDRTQADVDYALELNTKLHDGVELTSNEAADWSAGLKGAYNAADLNRVDAVVRDLAAKLTAVGYPIEVIEPKSLIYDDRVHKESELQNGCYLYASGEYDKRADYVCTIDMIPIRKGSESLTVRTDIAVGSDCGFLWYDEDGTFIGGTSGGARLIWDGCFQSVIPSGAAYFRANINADSVTPAKVGAFITRDYSYTSDEMMYIPSGTVGCSCCMTDGTQYVDLGYKPSGMHTSTKVYMEILGGTAPYYAIYGARDGGTQQFWTYYDDSVGKNGALVGRHNVTSLSHTIERRVSENVGFYPEFRKNVFEAAIQGESEILTAPVAEFNSAYSMFLSAVNNSGTAQYITKAELQAMEVYEDGVCLRSLISVTDSELRAFLYDLVSGYSFYDQNGDCFLADQYDPSLYSNNIISPEWEVGDTVTQEAWTQYLANVQALRDGYYAMSSSPELPEPTAPLTYTGANAIEKLIYDIQQLYEGMITLYRICGTFAAGNSYQTQYIRRV